MIDTAIVIIVGMFLGWNFPQPTYAKIFQKWVMDKWSNFGTKK